MGLIQQLIANMISYILTSRFFSKNNDSKQYILVGYYLYLLVEAGKYIR